MRKLFIAPALAVALFASGCVGSAEVRSVATLAVVCEVSNGVVKEATQLRRDGKLNETQEQIIGASVDVIDTACAVDSNVDPEIWVGKVRAAIDTIQTMIKGFNNK